MPPDLRDTIVDGRTLEEDPAAASSVSLVVVHRDGLAVVPLFEGEPLVVGREEPATLRPRSQRLSRLHARFLLEGQTVTVEDLGSTNGTFLGERRLTGPTPLKVGDEVRCGSVSITLRRGEAPPGRPLAGGGDVVVLDPAMRRLYDTVDRVAASQLTVLILGETGVGKELVARALHERSPRSRGPMRTINCGALPATLVESTLFGHEKGSFTGADQRRAGVFEEASGGTVLLDEVGELPAPAQAALLRVLETRRVQRVGSSAEIPVDVRVLSATHRDLEVACAEGRFRQDLLYRLNSVTLHVPPLRARTQEIEGLIEAFIGAANRANGRSVRGVTADALERLRNHAWPGNVRELRNVVERAVVVAQGPWITLDDLPESIAGMGFPSAFATPTLPPRVDELAAAPPLDLKARVLAFEAGLILGALDAEEGNQTRAAQRLQMPRRTLVYRLRELKTEGVERLPPTREPFRDRVEAFERQLVEEALARAGGDRAVAAQVLGIQRRTLTARLERWGLPD